MPAFLKTSMNRHLGRPDIRSPQTILLNPPGKYIVGQSYTFEVGAGDYSSDVGEIEFSIKLDKREWTDYVTDTAFNIPYLRDGTREFIVRARDKAGNVDASPVKISFLVNPHRNSIQDERIDFAIDSKVYSARHRYFTKSITEKGNLRLKNTSSRPLPVKISVDLPGYTEKPFAIATVIGARGSIVLPFTLNLNKNILVDHAKKESLIVTCRYKYDKLDGEQRFTREVSLEPPQAVF